jgi:hypothetical protein
MRSTIQVRRHGQFPTRECSKHVIAVMALAAPGIVSAFSVQATSSVGALLQEHANAISQLKTEAAAVLSESQQKSEPYCNDLFYLRYCLDDDNKFAESMKWRTTGPGQAIQAAAARAVAAATATNSWQNDAVWVNAPHSATISQFITPDNCRTSTIHENLLYCIRAGLIDDIGLMKAVSVDQLAEFFLYVKEVHAIVANQRSRDRLVQVVTVNDLCNIPLLPLGGGKSTAQQQFRQALSLASTTAAAVYPATYAGPTLLLNLPALLTAIVKLFTPLFPPAVNARLKFSSSATLKAASLNEICNPGSSLRTAFSDEVKQILS